MKKIEAQVWIDGRSVAADEARVSVFDRGFLHGDSVFEVLRTYERVPFALDERLERLRRSARLVSIELPVGVEVLRAEVETALARAAYPEAYLRLMLTRGAAEPASVGVPSGARRVLLVAPLVPLPAETYELGVAVVTQRSELVGNAVAPGAKVGNYLNSILALAAARRAGAAEALLVDRSGEIFEGSSSNVFLFSKGTLVTPPEEAGILAGITRSKVLALAGAWGVPVEQRTFTPRELLAADEAFVTASIREIVPVVRVDGDAIGGGRPGDFTRRLLAGYRALALGDAASALSSAATSAVN
jgi:branched-chain amino acid aminotransferase